MPPYAKPLSHFDVQALSTERYTWFAVFTNGQLRGKDNIERIRYHRSKYRPHQGEQECARRRTRV